MNVENKDKIFMINAPSKTKENRFQEKSKIDAGNYENEEKEIQSNVASPEKSNIGDINITKAYGTLHLGTIATFNGPVYITGLKKKDILSINESCKACREKMQKKEDLWFNNFEIPKNVKLFNKKLNVRKSVILAGSLLLAQLIILPLFAVIQSTTSVNNTYRCDGIEAKILRDLESLYDRRKFFPRKEWGSENNCLIDCCIKSSKSIVRLSIVYPTLLDVLMLTYYETGYTHILEHDLYIQMFDKSEPILNDIYYNFLIGFNDVIFEGRPLNCPFEEKMEKLKEDHSKIIIIGIPYCFIGNRTVTIENTRSLLITIHGLLDRLQCLGVLDKNFTLELPDICNSSTLLNLAVTDKRRSKNLIFYDYFENDPVNYYAKYYDSYASVLSFGYVEEINTSELDDIDNANESVFFPKPLFDKSYGCENRSEYLNSSYPQEIYNIYEFRFYFLEERNEELPYNESKFNEFLRFKSISIERLKNAFNYFLYVGWYDKFKDTQNDCKPTSQKIFNEKGEYKEVIGSRTIINFVNHTIWNHGYKKGLTNLEWSLAPIWRDQRKYNPLINNCKEHPHCDLNHIYVFDCSDYRNIEYSKFYEMFNFNVVYRWDVNSTYWYTDIDECYNSMIDKLIKIT